MNALRCTLYEQTALGTPESFNPMTVVILERDLRDDLSLAQAAMDQMDLNDEFGSLIITETFDVDDDVTIEEASMLAIDRMRQTALEERCMACLYQYEARMFPQTKSGAVLLGTIQAPLSAQATASTLQRLARHPDYDKHVVVMPTQDGNVVTLRDGDVTIEELPHE